MPFNYKNFRFQNLDLFLRKPVFMGRLYSACSATKSRENTEIMQIANLAIIHYRVNNKGADQTIHMHRLVSRCCSHAAKSCFLQTRPILLCPTVVDHALN